MARLRFRACASILLLAGLATGCGSGTKGTVSGTVTVGGQPLANGLITFVSQAGNRDSFSAAVINGSYTTAEIPVGPTKITIASRGVNPAEAPVKETGAGDNMPTKRPQKKATSLEVPSKYGSVDTSGLSHEVVKGANAKNFEL